MIINIFFPTKEFARLNLILKIRPRSTRKMAANCIRSQQQQRPLFSTLLTVLLEPNFPETYKVCRCHILIQDREESAIVKADARNDGVLTIT